MNSAATRETTHRARHGDLWLVGHQLKYEQLAFWRNRYSAIFTVGFSVIFLLLLGASGGTSTVNFLGGIRLIQYYVGGFAAYGVMSACFNTLGIQLVTRRETGLLKRLRLSPLPTWVLFAGIFLSAIVVAIVQVVLLLIIGRYGYNVVLPTNWLALIVALVAGVVCFTALGVAISTVVPNQDAAGPIISILYFVLLFLSGFWFPLKPGSGLARLSGYFPVRGLINAVFAPFDIRRGASPWAWHDVIVMMIWAFVGIVVAQRRFRFEPRRL